MPKVRKAELSFLYATCRLVLFYISTKPSSKKQNVGRNFQRGITLLIFGGLQTICTAPHHGLTINQVSGRSDLTVGVSRK